MDKSESRTLLMTDNWSWDSQPYVKKGYETALLAYAIFYGPMPSPRLVLCYFFPSSTFCLLGWRWWSLRGGEKSERPGIKERSEEKSSQKWTRKWEAGRNEWKKVRMNERKKERGIIIFTCNAIYCCPNYSVILQHFYKPAQKWLL